MFANRDPAALDTVFADHATADSRLLVAQYVFLAAATLSIS